MEMMLVITIMAIMLGAIVPNFKPFVESATIKDASRNLSQIIRYTRSLAVERSANTELTFDLETGEIMTLEENDPINAPGIFEPILLPVAYPKEYKTKVKVAAIVKQTLYGSQEDNVVSFQPDGATSDTFIYMVDSYEKVYTIGIVGLTGQVLVWDHAVQDFYE